MKSRQTIGPTAGTISLTAYSSALVAFSWRVPSGLAGREASNVPNMFVPAFSRLFMGLPAPSPVSRKTFDGHRDTRAGILPTMQAGHRFYDGEEFPALDSHFKPIAAGGLGTVERRVSLPQRDPETFLAWQRCV